MSETAVHSIAVLKYKLLDVDHYNLGDNFQTIAMKEMLHKCGIEDDVVCMVNRDEVGLPPSPWSSRLVNVIISGFFCETPNTNSLPVHCDYNPLFWGFHLNEGSWEHFSNNDVFRESMKDAEPIGCRDFGTRDYIRSLGIKAFYSGCSTLLLDKREVTPPADDVYFVDPLGDIEEFKPSIHNRNYKAISQVGPFPSGEKVETDEDVFIVEQRAIERLSLLKANAGLIITKRIHVALPAIAMGIPTVYTFDNPKHPRVEVLQDYIPIYTPEEYGNIDWSGHTIELDQWKKERLLLFKYMLHIKFGKTISSEEIDKGKVLLQKLCNSERNISTMQANDFSSQTFHSLLFRNAQFDEYQQGKKIVLYGFGSAGKQMKSLMEYFGYRVDYLYDKRLSDDSITVVENTSVISLEELEEKKSSLLVLIAVYAAYDEVVGLLCDRGIGHDSILGSKDLLLHFAHFVIPTETPIQKNKRALKK